MDELFFEHAVNCASSSFQVFLKVLMSEHGLAERLIPVMPHQQWHVALTQHAGYLRPCPRLALAISLADTSMRPP